MCDSQTRFQSSCDGLGLACVRYSSLPPGTWRTFDQCGRERCDGKLLSAGFLGSVRCTAPGEGMFTGLAVEVDGANLIFTTLPVAPVEERMPQE